MRIPAMIALALLVSASIIWASQEQRSSAADSEYATGDLQDNHITANVPPDSSFMTLLQRDVQKYLVGRKLPSKSVEVELLREGPTQSGVSYPKYYIWVRGTDQSGHRIEGAMRVAAIERVRFDITDFTPAASIRSDPASLASIYPALLIPAIRQRASAD